MSDALFYRHWTAWKDGTRTHILLSDVFFSSRRRHTSSLCDWSSDVCSSDLTLPGSSPEVRVWSTTAAVGGRTAGEVCSGRVALVMPSPRRPRARRVGGIAGAEQHCLHGCRPPPGPRRQVLGDAISVPNPDFPHAGGTQPVPGCGAASPGNPDIL